MIGDLNEKILFVLFVISLSTGYKDAPAVAASSFTCKVGDKVVESIGSVGKRIALCSDSSGVMYTTATCSVDDHITFVDGRNVECDKHSDPISTTSSSRPSLMCPIGQSIIVSNKAGQSQASCVDQ